MRADINDIVSKDKVSFKKKSTKKIGRPTIGDKSKKIMISTYLSTEEHEELLTYLEEHGTPKSTFIRKLILDKLK